MSMWDAYFLSFFIDSPIFMGYSASSGMGRSRHYLLPGNMTGAFTNSISRYTGGIISKEGIKKNFLFTTFFLSSDGVNALYPSITHDGNLIYGSEGLSVMDFRNQFISNTEASKYQMFKNLSHLEFLVPENQITGARLYLVGYLFVHERAQEKKYKDWLHAFKRLIVGEERSMGLGRVSLNKLEKVDSQGDELMLFSLEGINANLKNDDLIVNYSQPDPLLAHTLLDGAQEEVAGVYGVREKISETTDLLNDVSISGKSGAYWVPGSLVVPRRAAISFKIMPNGIWHAH